MSKIYLLICLILIIGEIAMAEEKKFTVVEAHQAFANGLFNKTWELLEKTERTSEDDEMMINTSHASLYHWKKIGKPINFQRGEWMVAHVYTILSKKESALYHAKICLDLTKKNDILDFDLAFGYECYSRALALNENKEESKKYFELAKKAGKKIVKKEDRDYFLQVLEDGPWFDIK